MIQIYLVSASPRRRDLLRQIGISFETLLLRADPVRGADVDETPQANEDPHDYVRRVAQAKAETGWRRLFDRRLPPRPVLAADTTVVLDGKIIGKPANAADAMEILARLSGREHQVLTAVALATDAGIELSLSESKVFFSELGEREIREYVASGEPLDKAGAYAIQGRAAAFVSRLEGSYSGVMGLPLFETARLLKGRI